MINKFQQGGQPQQANQQKLAQYIAQAFGAQSQEDLQKIVQQLGEQGIKVMEQMMSQGVPPEQAAQQIQQISQQQAQSAKNGARLNYIKQLKGQCPEGYEMQYFKAGGCMKCAKAKASTKESAVSGFKKQKGGKAKYFPKNPVDAVPESNTSKPKLHPIKK